MADYQQGKIYKIVSDQTTDKYIGSTILSLETRFTLHKEKFIEWLGKNKYKQYSSSFKILQHDDAKIELIENFPCNSKSELFKREGELIKELNAINKRVAGRKCKEYYQDNKEKVLARVHQYAENNKEKIAEKGKQYREKNNEVIKEKKRQIEFCEACKKEINKNHRARHLQTQAHINNSKYLA